VSPPRHACERILQGRYYAWSIRRCVRYRASACMGEKGSAALSCPRVAGYLNHYVHQFNSVPVTLEGVISVGRFRGLRVSPPHHAGV
jgi:hypothetical protein